MKLTRRAFIKLVPIGAAISVASWWFLKQETPTTSSGTVESVSSSQATATTGGTSDFPVTWDTDQPFNVDPIDYRLRVDGDVSNPVQLTLEELYAMPSVNASSTIRCVEAWSALVAWEGIPLSRLLSLAGAPSEFDHVTVESITGFAVKIGQNDVANPGTMIALKVGSAPLKVEHGYPARLVLPTRPGYEWVKYLGRITCTKAQTG